MLNALPDFSFGLYSLALVKWIFISPQNFMECRLGDLDCCDYYHDFVLPVTHKHIRTQLIVDLQWLLSSHLSLTCGTIYISV